MAAESNFTFPNPHEPTKPFSIVPLSGVVKLTQSNYLNWQLQIEAILDGLDLYKFLDGSHPAPAAFINNTDTPPVSQANPAYLSWKRQDHLIYGTLLTTLSDSVASIVTQTKTSAALWSTLKGTFARASRGHVKQLKDRLCSMVKGTLSVTEFMNNIKIVVDLLASIGHSVSVEDVTDHVLRGLDETFKPVIDGVNARDNPIAFDELHEKLLQHELHLKTTHQITLGPTTALTAQAKPNKPKPRPYTQSQWSSPPPNTS
ncbi:hypothetical protein V8G54_021726 [Vigna mungo]|uniref:Retrotransposon Copia-like N-terminal domain-containing protein n=1 Tax=Vigna mungo TaxID=3915 RepID=A0AAQ3NG66_VIGMU